MTIPSPHFECLRHRSWFVAPTRCATFKSFAALDPSRANYNLVTVPTRTRTDSRLVCRYEQPTETFTNTATKLTETRYGTGCLTEMVIADECPSARLVELGQSPTRRACHRMSAPSTIRGQRHRSFSPPLRERSRPRQRLSSVRAIRSRSCPSRRGSKRIFLCDLASGGEARGAAQFPRTTVQKEA